MTPQGNYEGNSNSTAAPKQAVLPTNSSLNKNTKAFSTNRIDSIAIIKKDLLKFNDKIKEHPSMEAKSDFFQIIKDLDTSEVLDLLITFDNDGNLEGLSGLIFERLTDLDPILSLDYLIDNDMFNRNGREALDTMQRIAHNDPDQALQWYRQNITAQNRRLVYWGMNKIFSSYAKSDLGGATNTLLTLPQREAEYAIDGIASSFDSPDDYVNYLGLTEDLNKPYLQEAVMRQWARKYPQAMALYLSEKYQADDFYSRNYANGGDRKFEERLILLSNWSQNEPVKASTWFLESVPEEFKGETLKQLVSMGHLYARPQDSLDWLRNIYDINTQTAIDTLIARSFSADVDFTIEHLKFIKSDSKRANVQKKIYKKLLKEDPDRALIFLQSTGLEEAELVPSF
jgi:hypothetical protein